MPPIDNLTTAQRYELFGRPRKILLDEVSWKQAELVEPLKFPKGCVGSNVYLGDFGLCIKAGTPVKRRMQGPARFCAPELFHGADPSFATDMWAYMNLFACFYLGTDAIWGEGLLLTTRIIETFGPFPTHWKGSHYLQHVDKSGWFNPNPDMDYWYDPQTKTVPKMSLESKIDRLRPDISENERYHALKVMYRGFQYLPENRLTAAQLLEDESFKIVMGFYGI